MHTRRGPQVPFAGHPTLGLAWAITQLGLAEPEAPLTLRLNDGGSVTVTAPATPDGAWWMKQQSPTFLPPLPLDQLQSLVPEASALVDVGMLTVRFCHVESSS